MNSDARNPNHSVTLLIDQLKTRDSAAAAELWQRYFQRLLPLARAKLRSLSGQYVDEEDILISVFDRLFTAAADGKFARLSDRNDLWQILLMLTDRKVIDQRRKLNADKRGSGEVVRESELSVELDELRELADRAPGPQWLAAFNENLKAALMRLQNEKTREVALNKLEGHTNQEISEKLGISLSSVERKLRVIREVWQQAFGKVE